MTSPRRAILLDTTVLIDLLRQQPEAVAVLRDLIAHRYSLATSCVNVAEVYAGMRKGEESDTELLLSGLQRLPVSEEIARTAGRIVAERRRAGRTHSLDAMMIAATAMEYGYILLTDNQKDFQISGLKLFPLP